eukprot:TRINITY_DN8645_c0_g1_i1.p1 TRINITY_DN8645_c0_g1~~TRINITY_DN8645_c0_g1_i1.p1  ORF type:complete len:217 (-),score=9.10 TRINITY_DN8645_c0_g1_i1:100-693(-)
MCIRDRYQRRVHGYAWKINQETIQKFESSFPRTPEVLNDLINSDVRLDQEYLVDNYIERINNLVSKKVQDLYVQSYTDHSDFNILMLVFMIMGGFVSFGIIYAVSYTRINGEFFVIKKFFRLLPLDVFLRDKGFAKHLSKTSPNTFVSSKRFNQVLLSFHLKGKQSSPTLFFQTRLFMFLQVVYFSALMMFINAWIT